MNASRGAVVSRIILKLGTWWSWVVSFTPQLLKPLYHWSRRRGGPQSQSRHCCRTDIFLANRGNQTLDEPAPSPVILPLTVSWLLNDKMYNQNITLLLSVSKKKSPSKYTVLNVSKYQWLCKVFSTFYYVP